MFAAALSFIKKFSVLCAVRSMCGVLGDNRPSLLNYAMCVGESLTLSVSMGDELTRNDSVREIKPKFFMSLFLLSLNVAIRRCLKDAIRVYLESLNFTTDISPFFLRFFLLVVSV